jgi:hypothetical protein
VHSPFQIEPRQLPPVFRLRSHHDLPPTTDFTDHLLKTLKRDSVLSPCPRAHGGDTVVDCGRVGGHFLDVNLGQALSCRVSEWFTSIEQARVVITQWLRQYNQIRPHHALSMRPQVPETILEKPRISGPV